VLLVHAGTALGRAAESTNVSGIGTGEVSA
jgi:hypothetical protein